MPTVTKALGALDAGWLLLESEVNHMHVGGLIVLRKPPEAAEDFVAKLVAEMREHTVASAPFNRRIVRSGLGRIWPRAEEVAEVDLEHHLRHQAVPKPGGQRELGILISRLHSIPLDLTRPPWEFHVIEGLEDDRFAIYVKAHHCLIDGDGAVRLAKKVMSTDPEERGKPPVWAQDWARSTASASGTESSLGGPKTWAKALYRQVKLGAQTTRALLDTFAGVHLGGSGDENLTRAFRAPDSVFNSAITAHRRVAAQAYDLERFRALADRLGCTINDAVLAVCSGGLRRYLDENESLPARSLVAGLPVSVRPSDSPDPTGTAISFALSELATDATEVRERVARIMASTASAKQHLSSMPRDSVNYYTVGLVAPLAVTQLAGIGHWGSPLFNLVISNVAGPTKPLYLNGALVEQAHPVSVILGGQALNITALSYAERVNLSFTGCRDALPDIQSLASACDDALEELEKVFADASDK